MGADNKNEVRERKKDGNKDVNNKQKEDKKEELKKLEKTPKNNNKDETIPIPNDKISKTEKAEVEQENDKVLEELGTSCCKLFLLLLFLLLVLLLSLLLLLLNFNFAFHTNLFDSTSQQRYSQRTQDQQIRIPVSLEDIYFGNLVSFEKPRTVICNKCNGEGVKPEAKVNKCPVCGGTGAVIKRQQMGHITYERQVQCTACNGHGIQLKESDKCPRCKAQGLVKENTKVKIVLPKGIAEGEYVVAKGYANELQGYETGDLYCFIQVQPHAVFRRKEVIHLEIDVKISLLEALTGFKRKIKHISGQEITIRRSEVTAHGDVLEFPGSGMPIRDQSGTGNLYVNIHVQFPEKLSNEKLKGLESILRSIE